MTRLTFLGTGTSLGVPIIGCDFGVCRSSDPRDRRLRSSALIRHDGLDILVDAGPDFRQQMLRAGVRHLDAILLTHGHKDHTGGLDDIRAFNYVERAPARIYCEALVEESLRQEYAYAFSEKRYPGVPEWQITTIDENPFTVTENIPKMRLTWVEGKGYEKVPASPDILAKKPAETVVIPIRGRHYMLPVLGYRFGKIAYLTDMNHIPEEEFEKLHGLEHFVINCVRRERHISHFSLPQAIEVARRVGARHSWLTHLSHQLPRYADLCAELPPDIRPAYDGLVIEA